MRGCGQWIAPLLILMLALAAQAADTNGMDTNYFDTNGFDLLPKDLDIPLWDKSLAVRGGIGYKDNVLLDNSGRRASPFFTSGLDVTIFRLPLNDWEFEFVGSGDDIRYWKDVGVGSEDTWVAGAKLKRELPDDWEAGVTVSYAYLDSVVDLANEQIEVVGQAAPAVVIAHIITVEPALRKDWNTNLWIETGFEGIRQYMTSPGDALWQFGPKITFGHDYGYRSAITLSYELLDELDDTLPETDSDGNPVGDATLAEIHQQVELAWRHNWDEDRHWQSTTKLTYERVVDNGGGFYNFDRYAASEKFTYRGKSWGASAQAAWVYYDYPYQVVDPTNPSDPTKWYLNGLTLDAHLEKSLFKNLKIFADYEHENSRSDRIADAYEVNTVTGGLEWEF